jgi:hypothetical protein
MKPGIKILALFAMLSAVAHAEEPQSPSNAASTGFSGLLRGRDLTPFGYLRLDMMPASVMHLPTGASAVEAQFGYQNTWAMSDNVKQYLEQRNTRTNLTAADAAAIRSMPGEAYFVDMELGQLDLVWHYQIAEPLSAYLVTSAVHFGGGFMDAAIEDFHSAFGLGDADRPTVTRNQFNVIVNTKTSQATHLDGAGESKLLDPVAGLRYSALAPEASAQLIFELATKIPVAGFRERASTGRFDVGAAVTGQYFGTFNAFYLNLAAVYHDHADVMPLDVPSGIVPTAIAGWEHRLTNATSVVTQTYLSRSTYRATDTELSELDRPKILVSVGMRQRMGPNTLTLGVTENLRSFNNTPDIAFELGWTYTPGL